MLKNNIVIIFVVFFFIVGCKVSQKEVEKPLKEKQEIAEEAITAWIINTNEYLYYKPVVFGELSARYVRNNQTLPLLAELTSVVDSLQDEVKADSLRRELKRIEGGLLGYLLVH